MRFGIKSIFLFAWIFSIPLKTQFAVNSQTQDTLLLQAIADDQPDSVQTLLRKGANPNARNERGCPALLLAATKGSLRIVTTLIKMGAQVDLASTENGLTPLIAASVKGYEQIVRILVAKKATVNVRDADGDTALMVAAGEGEVPIMSFLLANGGDFNAQNNRGMTALMLAASQCKQDAVKKLWDAGASINQKDHSGNTAETYATIGKCPSILRVAAVSECKDMSSLYSLRELQQWQPVFKRQILQAKEQIERELTLEGRDKDSDQLRQAQVVTPLFGEIEQSAKACKQPFYYVSFARDRSHSIPRIVIPTLSVMFLRGLLTANWWLLKHGYESKANQYVSMLKYKRVSDFPDGKYPAPLGALEVPHTSDEEPRYDDAGSRDEGEAKFAKTLFFITAHEAAHVIYEHAESTQENETVADDFALEIAIKKGMLTEGLGELFGFLSYWVPNGGDFESEFQYKVWLGSEATHPVTAFRIRSLGVRISGIPHRFSLLLTWPASPRINTSGLTDKVLEEMGSSLVSTGERIDRQTSSPDLFWEALATSLSTLAPTKASP